MCVDIASPWWSSLCDDQRVSSMAQYVVNRRKREISKTNETIRPSVLSPPRCTRLDYRQRASASTLVLTLISSLSNELLLPAYLLTGRSSTHLFATTDVLSSQPIVDLHQCVTHSETTPSISTACCPQVQGEFDLCLRVCVMKEGDWPAFDIRRVL